MTYNNYLSNQQYQPVSSASAIFQPGFAGTNAQEVRSDIQRSQQNFGQSNQSFAQMGQGFNQGYNQSTQSFLPQPSVQAIFQPGFAGTNAQEVRNDYLQSQQNFGQYQPNVNQQMMNMGQMGGYSQSMQGFAPQSSVQAIFQPGFAGTNAQEVRSDIQRSQQNFGQPGMGQQPFVSSMSGANAIFQPGFAGTNAQEVRNDYMQSQQNFGQPMSMSFSSPMSGANAIFQPGFAGTNVQEVRNDYRQSQQNFGQPMSFSQQSLGGLNQQQMSATPYGSSASSMLQPGFAGTNAQEVRNDYMQSQQSRSYQPYSPYTTH